MNRLGIVAFVVLAAFAGFPAAAQDGAAPAADTRRELADRVVKAGYESDVAERIMSAFWPVALGVIKERVPDVTQVQIFQYQGKTTAFVAEAAHAGLAPLVEMFARGFSEEELEVIAAFYESPAGRKLNGAQGTIASVLSGAAGASLKTEINGLRDKVDGLLAADGY